MSHPLEQLSPLLDGELDAAARAHVEAHLAGCAACSAHLAELAALDEMARRSAVSAPEGYFDALPGRIRSRVRARRRPLAAAPWVWAAAASVLLAVLVPLTMIQRSAPGAAPVAPAPPLEAARGGTPAVTMAPPQAPIARLGRAATPAPTQAPPPAFRDQARPERERDQDAGAAMAAAKKADSFAAAPQEQARSNEGGVAGAPAAANAVRPVFAPPPAPSTTPPTALAETITVTGETKPAEREDAVAPSATAPSGLAVGATAAQRAKRRQEASEAQDAPAAGARSPGFDETAEEKLAKDRAGSRFEAGPAALSPEARARYDALAARTARRATDARELREAWRAFARVHAQAPEADEARVRTIEAGVLTWRLARDLPDLYVVHADAQLYLAAAAPQSDRVRRAIRGLPSP